MRSIVLFFLATVAAGALQAQNMAGGKAGLNYSLYNIDEQKENGAHSRGHDGSFTGIGWQVGGYFQHNFSRNVGLRTELLWSVRKMSHDLDWKLVADTTDDLTYTLSGTYTETRSYLEIPILLALQMGKHFTLHVGPGVGVLMGAHRVEDGTFTWKNNTATIDTSFASGYDLSGEDGKSGQNAIDIGACLGAVYELDAGLAIGIRDWYSLSALEDPIDFTETRGMVLQFFVGWNFMDERRSHRR